MLKADPQLWEAHSETRLSPDAPGFLQLPNSQGRKVMSELYKYHQITGLLSRKGCCFLFFMGPEVSKSREASQTQPGKERCQTHGCLLHLLPSPGVCKEKVKLPHVVLSLGQGPIWHPLDSGPRATGNVARTSNFKSRSHSFLRVTLGPQSPL